MIDKQTFERAIAEQQKLATGYVPTDDDLDGAPVIDSWGLVQDGPALAVVGYVTGHPTIADGPVTTSKLIAVDPELRWARTISRYYRLGQRAVMQ